MNKMSSIRLTTLLSALLMTLVWSCKPSATTGDQALLGVPMNSGSVTRVNFQNLMDKADFEEVKKMDFFAQMVDDAHKENPAFAEILQDPTKTGINLSSNAYFFMTPNPTTSKTKGGMVMALENKADFEKMLDEAKMGDTKEASGIKYKQGGSGNVVAWNEQMAFTGSGYFNEDMEVLLKTIFNTDPTLSVASHPGYQKRMAESHDISTWVNLNPILEQLPPMTKMPLSLAGITDDHLKDNFLKGYWDFNDGEMEGNLKYFMKKGLTKDFSAFFKDKVETDFSTKIPGENLGAAFSLGLDFKGMNQVLKEKGVHQNVDANFKYAGVSLDELVAALGGDVSMAFYPIAGTEEASEVLMTSTITKQETIQKILDFALSSGTLKKDGDLYLMPDGASELRENLGPNGSNDAWIVLKKDLLYMGSSKEMVTLVAGGKFKDATSVDGLQKAISKDIFGGFMNFAAMDPLTKGMDLSKFEEMNFSAGRNDATVKLKTTAKNENSLKSLMIMGNEQFKKDNIKIES